MIIIPIKLAFLRACTSGQLFFSGHYKEIETVELLRDMLQYEEEIRVKYDQDVYKWCYWLIVKMLSIKEFGMDDAVQFAIFAAEKSLHVFEESYPEDNGPRQAIDVAKALRSYEPCSWKSLEEAKTAIRQAVEFSSGRASDSAYSALFALRASYCDPGTLLASAAYYAINADPSLKDEILEFGIELLQEEEE